MKTKSVKATTNKATARETGVKYFAPETIVSEAIVPEGDKGATRYKLAEGITLGIVFTDKDYDFGFLDFFGLNVNVTIRSGKSGMFISFPSVKNKAGEYVDMARVYDTNFHKCVKDVLALVYAEE